MGFKGLIKGDLFQDVDDLLREWNLIVDMVKMRNFDFNLIENTKLNILSYFNHRTKESDINYEGDDIERSVDYKRSSAMVAELENILKGIITKL